MKKEIEIKIKKAEKEIKEATQIIEEAKDCVINEARKKHSLLGAARDLEKAEDSALIACEATEEAEFKLQKN